MKLRRGEREPDATHIEPRRARRPRREGFRPCNACRDDASMARSARAAPFRAARRLLDALTSLKLTIACFAALMALVVACTLGQVHEGTWGAVETYMRSWFCSRSDSAVGRIDPDLPRAAFSSASSSRSTWSPRRRGGSSSPGRRGHLAHARWAHRARRRRVRDGRVPGGRADEHRGGADRELRREPSRGSSSPSSTTTDPAHDEVHAIPESLARARGLHRDRRARRCRST